MLLFLNDVWVYVRTWERACISIGSCTLYAHIFVHTHFCTHTHMYPHIFVPTYAHICNPSGIVAAAALVAATDTRCRLALRRDASSGMAAEWGQAVGEAVGLAVLLAGITPPVQGNSSSSSTQG